MTVRQNNQHGALGRRINTAAQIQLLISLLRSGPRHTHYLRRQGISRPGGRVQDLRDDGWVISTHRVTTIDSDGFAHDAVALYTLINEPDPTKAPFLSRGSNGDLFGPAVGACS